MAAIVIAVIILLFKDKYAVSLISSEFKGQKIHIYYRDLDHDGNSERIELHKYVELRSSLLVYKNEQVIDQWNFDGEFAFLSQPIVDDFDNDGIDEIFLFVRFGDSLFLNCVDAVSREEVFSNIPICKFYPLNDIYAYNVHPAGMYDTDGDGIKELYFSIATGFTTRPRKMFAYNPAIDSLFISPESCALFYKQHAFDLDGDSIPEFLGRNVAVDNCGSDREYSDLYSWLMVFTPEMKFKFPPLVVGKYPSNTEFIPFRGKDKNHILAIHNYRGTEDISDFIAFYDENGVKQTSRELEKEIQLDEARLFNADKSYKSIYLLTSTDGIYYVNENLKIKKIADIGELKARSPLRIDVDNDEEQEYIFIAAKNRLTIVRSDFRHPVEIELTDMFTNLIISIILKKSETPKIALNSGNSIYIYSYYQTLVYKYWYLLLPILFVPCLLIMIFFEKIREYRKIKVSHTRKELVELQLKSIQNQIDPHFTFNLLQSFGLLLNEKDTERAEYLFNKYADMLKTTVLNSDKVFVPLQEELDFVDSYLFLERFRQKEKFIHDIQISEEVDTSLKIPKMLIHTFIENSIKHGIRHLESNGKLVIDACKNNGMIILTITDNGVGRAKAAEYARFSTGKGLGILDQILDLYFLLYKTRIQYKIIDIFDEGRPGGTRVEITIPV